MKTKSLILGAIFVFLSVATRAQITEMLFQGFESGETVHYSGSPSAGVRSSSVFFMGGERSLKLVQQSDVNVEIILDTLDFTTNTSLKYIALEFDHMCPIKTNPGDINIGTIYYKRASQNEWTKVSGQDYNIDRDVYSTAFKTTGAFSQESYPNDWKDTATNNTMWRHERFDLDNVITSGIAVSERKLLIKFVLKKRTLSGVLDTVNNAWWIDNLKISSSAERMVTPKIAPVVFPHMTESDGSYTWNANRFPNGRVARIELDATTSVVAGINPDSVYMYYTVGSDTVPVRKSMTHVSGDRYRALIPFFGYDTAMRFYCVVKDATGNENTATYPAAVDSWVNFRFDRGVGNPPSPGDVINGTISSSDFVFPWDADHRCQFILDSATLHDAGYDIGSITQIKFIAGGSVASSQPHNRLKVRMKNIPNSYQVLAENEGVTFYYFDNSYMHVVYDSAYTIPAVAAGDTIRIYLQDTFFYAGSDILMNVWYDHDENLTGVPVMMMNTAVNKASLHTHDMDAEYNADAFVASQFLTSQPAPSYMRPLVFFNEVKNQPLLYDAGVGELVDPNYYVAMDKDEGLIQIRLNNFGSNAFNNVRVSYNIDDTIFGYKDYTQTLGGGANVIFNVDEGVDLPAGFHTLKVWVEDSVTASGTLYRDHEPYNDTLFSEFIVCDGPMNGVRNIGGSNPHFNTVEEFLFSLQRCGIDDSLIVRLAPGYYMPFTMPSVTGISDEHYIVFESMDEDNRATIFSDSTYTQGSIVNLDAVSNVRLRNLNMVRRNGALTNMVSMSATSANCVFEGCQFIDSLENPQASMRIDAMLDNSNATNMIVRNCSFEGGRIGVYVHGQSTILRSNDATVASSNFHLQYENAIKVENMTNVSIEDNAMNDVLSNAYYVLQINNTDGTVSVQRNKIYTTHGAGAFAVSGVEGTSTNPAIIANNMMEGNDNGEAALMRSVFNMIQASYTDFVYNAVKQNAPTRSNIAAAVFGGTSLENCNFWNNIIASMDEVNYALGYQVGSSTTNHIGHNVYYSGASVLNRRGTVSYIDLHNWQIAVPEDSLSISVAPEFLNGSWADLRTFNRAMSGIGIPYTAVPTDMFGNERGIDSTCPGAFEFSALPYDFLPTMLSNPVADNCNMPEQTELVFVIRNNGVDHYTAEGGEPLTLSWTINGSPVTTINVSKDVPPEDTVTVSTGSFVQMPPNGILDSIYTVRAWVDFESDPNQTNDTAVFKVISRYHPAAPADILDSVDYASIDTIVPTVGVDKWEVYGNTSAPKRQSKIYWYEDSTSTEPFYIGDTLITDELREDMTYYIRQRRSMPIVRITQVEILKNGAGKTTPAPYWMHDSRKAAVQLTNVGDATAYLGGDSLILVSPTASLNDKVYVFNNNVKIEPGASLVVQYAAAGVTDSSVTLRNGMNSITLSATSNIAFVYRRGGVVEDALPLNNVITANTTQAVSWASMNVPSYVWNGSALSYQSGIAGLVRTGFSGNMNDWAYSSNDEPMFLGSNDPTWVRYEDGGCEGDLATVTLGIIAPPVVELALDAPILPENNCNLGDEPVSVRIRNYGSEAISGIVANYCVGEDTVTESIGGTLGSFEDTVYTFAQKTNFAYIKDTTYQVKVWVNAMEDDPMHQNDTSVANLFSKYTPDVPAAIATRMIPYATCDTITLDEIDGILPVWYDYDLNPVDTGYTSVSEILYVDGVRGVNYLVVDTVSEQLGGGVESNAASTYPSPFQSTFKYIKQQYLYPASSLKTSELKNGIIKELAFHLDVIGGTTDSIRYLNYTMALGSTNDTVFANNQAWKESVTMVFQRDTLVLYDSMESSWVELPLDVDYIWDGTSSIVVQVSYELSTQVSSGVRTYYSPRNGASLYKTSNSALTPSTYGFNMAGSIANYLPDIRFSGITYGCTGPMLTYGIQMTDVPSIDAAIFWPDGFDTISFSSCDDVIIPLKFRNQGENTINEAKLYYYLDDEEVDSTMISGTYAQGVMHDVELFSRSFVPGKHVLKVVVSAEGDSIASNDTIFGEFVVRFCSGEYTVKADSTGDYASVAEVAETLKEVGILGPVVFKVYGATYTEQVLLETIYGSSPENTVSFVGQDDSVRIAVATTLQNNYVMMLNGASNVIVENIGFESRPPANNAVKANVLVLNNNNNIKIDNCRMKVRYPIVDTAAACVVLQSNVCGVTIMNSVMDSGGYSIKSMSGQTNSSTLKILNNTMRDFGVGGVCLYSTERLRIGGNELRSSNSANNRGVIGIYVSGTSDSVVIEKNKVYLIDNTMGAKRGVHLEHISGTMLNPAIVANNMIGTHGVDSKGLVPAKSAGIWIDSLSSYVNVFFNTVQVYGTSSKASAANDLSYAFYCGGTTDHLQVMNNLFANASRGYAYYVSEINNIVSSNFNAYYTDTTVAKKFAWKNTNLGNLTDLQNENNDDGNSMAGVAAEPFFVAEDDLHLLRTNFVGKAQYNAEIVDDIDGVMRKQMPAPTIGAHEMDQLMHDVAVLRIIEPVMPVNTNNPNNIETDSVRVIATFSNNGMMPESGLKWCAYIEGYESDTRSADKLLPTMASTAMLTDTLMMPTKVGIVENQVVRVVLVCDEDMDLENNERQTPVFLGPAYNLAGKKMIYSGGCNLKSVPIKIQVRNEGQKVIPSGTVVTIGYKAEVISPSNVTIPTLTSFVQQTATLTSDLAIGNTQEFTFSQNANLYPTDTNINIKVRVRGWCKYQYDVKVENDTSSTASSDSPVVDSYFTPTSPVGHDTTVAYGSWGAVVAEQENSRPIRWYRDTTQAPFYAPSTYAASTKWSNTPQYFHDSTYYLLCISDKQCSSAYSPVHVSVAARIPRDMAMEEIYSPLGKRVYMENDTVKVRVANYGTSAQTNVPVTYLLKQGNSVLQTTTEYIPSISAGQTLDYQFATLLSLPNPTTAQTFSLVVYTDLTNDGTRMNDTLHTNYSFSSYSESRYNNFDWQPTSEDTKFDITRLSFNSIDVEMPVLNRNYTNLADYTNLDYPALHVFRGTTDSIFIEVAPIIASPLPFRCRATVDVDFNRNGYFDDSTASPCTERLVSAEPFYSDSIFGASLTIPECAELGYMRMRVAVKGYDPASTEGHVIDLMLFVQDERPANDLALSHIVSPRDYRITNGDTNVVTFRMDNRGFNTITSADIYYKFVDDNFTWSGEVPVEDTIAPGDSTGMDTVVVDTTGVGVLHWTGALTPGQSTLVSLPGRPFAVGTSRLVVWHDMPGDADHSNDTLTREYHRFRRIVLTYEDDFDSKDYWYAPTGSSEFSRNYWQRGKPDKSRVNGTHSGDYAWATDLHNSITSGRRGNVSYLYSPIFNISVIRGDSLEFRLIRNLSAGSMMYVEYLDHAGKWMKIDPDSVTTWYNDEEQHAFTGTSASNDGYTLYKISTSATKVNGNFGTELQFRFVYTTAIGSNSSATFGEGCAIDNFRLKRAPRNVDHGVVSISYPDAPHYGETVYPRVVVQNFGLDTLKSFTVAYRHYGAGLAKVSTVNCLLPPGAKDEFECSSSFTITRDYPESFYMTAYTINNDDKYHDNDTAYKVVNIMPLDDDISAEEILAPIDKVVAGDSLVQVTLRMQNFGFNDINTIHAGYLLNGELVSEEEVNFDSILGGPLPSLEFFNYTFEKKMTPSLGTNIVTAYVRIDKPNTYVYNDTVTTRTQGIMSVIDLAAKAVIIDTMAPNKMTRIGMVIENKGTLSANNFDVAYWIDDDTNTINYEVYTRAEPLPALSTGYFIFEYMLVHRSKPYDNVKVMVSVANDNDRSNDTTAEVAVQNSDLEVTKVIVEENASDKCRVFVQVRNVGNLAFVDRQFRFNAVVNGESISANYTQQLNAGETAHFEFPVRINKSPQRKYVGSCSVDPVETDTNHVNDQTSVVEVVNYVDGIDDVDGSLFTLEQNYPNPFTHQTVVPFTLPVDAQVTFFVLDATGHIVMRETKRYSEGRHELTVDMDRFPTGVYFYGIEVGGQRQTRKMILK